MFGSSGERRPCLSPQRMQSERAGCSRGEQVSDGSGEQVLARAGPPAVLRLGPRHVQADRDGPDRPAARELHRELRLELDPLHRCGPPTTCTATSTPSRSATTSVFLLLHQHPPRQSSPLPPTHRPTHGHSPTTTTTTRLPVEQPAAQAPTCADTCVPGPAALCVRATRTGLLRAVRARGTGQLAPAPGVPCVPRTVVVHRSTPHTM